MKAAKVKLPTIRGRSVDEGDIGAYPLVFDEHGMIQVVDNNCQPLITARLNEINKLFGTGQLCGIVDGAGRVIAVRTRAKPMAFLSFIRYERLGRPFNPGVKGQAYTALMAVRPGHRTMQKPNRICSGCWKAHEQPFLGEVCDACTRKRNIKLAALDGRVRRVRELAANGQHTEKEWQDLLDRFGRKCLRCGTLDGLTRDHIQPLISGGSNFIANIQPLCRPCNSWKGVRTIDFRRVQNI
jgi:5-methylcytosine-specific restriction endonuclease McrA